MNPINAFRMFAATTRHALRPGIKIGRGVLIDHRSVLETPCRIGPMVRLKQCHIGRGTYLNGYSHLESTRFGRFCSIGVELRVSAGRHPTRTYATTHPAFFSTRKQAGFTFATHTTFPELPAETNGQSTFIGNDVWIGDRVTILGGLTIPDGSVIGAGSVVTRSLEPYCIYAGIPARKIGERFDKDLALRLSQSQWWDRDLDWLSCHWTHAADASKWLKLLEASPPSRNELPRTDNHVQQA